LRHAPPIPPSLEPPRERSTVRHIPLNQRQRSIDSSILSSLKQISTSNRSHHGIDRTPTPWPNLNQPHQTSLLRPPSQRHNQMSQWHNHIDCSVSLYRISAPLHVTMADHQGMDGIKLISTPLPKPPHGAYDYTNNTPSKTIIAPWQRGHQTTSAKLDPLKQSDHQISRSAPWPSLNQNSN
jgi:hypothetical protein